MGTVVTGNDGNDYDMDEVRAAAETFLAKVDGIVVERNASGVCTALKLLGKWLPVDCEDESHKRALKTLGIQMIEDA